MNKLFKGAIASAAGVALLLGGAGTFAMWNDIAYFEDDGVITAGSLEFVDHTMDDAVWALNGTEITDDNVDGSVDDEIAAVRIVPGDTLTMSWEDIGVNVEGDYLKAKFGVDLSEFAAGIDDPDVLAFYNLLNPIIEVTETTNGSVAHAADEEIELAAGVHTFDVTAKVFFDQEATNAVQKAEIELGGLGLTIDQVAHTPEHPPYPAPQEP